MGATATADDVAWSVWVQRLGSDAYAMRVRATAELRRGGTAAVPALRQGTLQPDLEIRQRSLNLLRELEADDFEAQLSALRQPHVPGREITLPGWIAFRKQAGQGRDARRLFAAIASRHRDDLEHYAAALACPSGDSTDGPLHRFQPLRQDRQRQLTRDPRLRKSLYDGDPSVWGLALLLATHPQTRSPLQTYRLRGDLAVKATRETLQRSPHAAALEEMVRTFLVSGPEPVADELTIRLALQWQFDDLATRLAHQVTQGTASASPGDVATGLLVLARHDPEALAPAVKRWIEDKRTAESWQIVASTRRRLQTQVRDVALAVWADHEGIDPRTLGYQDLEADPLTRYRLHTLGFPDDAARQSARSAASSQGLLRLGFSLETELLILRP